jgi:lysozyme family protein
MNAFDRAFDHVVGVEGGFSNHPDDRGGATKYGITQDVLASYRGKPVDEDDVKNLQLAEAKMIYRARYWNALGCDGIKSELVAQLLFDQGVNRGVTAAAKSIQQLVGVKTDGKIGTASLAAINGTESKALAFHFVCAAQEAYARIVQNNPSQAVFLVGWLRRSFKLFEMVLKA